MKWSFFRTGQLPLLESSAFDSQTASVSTILEFLVAFPVKLMPALAGCTGRITHIPAHLDRHRPDMFLCLTTGKLFDRTALRCRICVRPSRRPDSRKGTETQTQCNDDDPNDKTFHGYSSFPVFVIPPVLFSWTSDNIYPFSIFWTKWAMQAYPFSSKSTRTVLPGLMVLFPTMRALL